MAQQSNILTTANYNELTKALNSLANGYRTIELLEETGTDMTEYRNHFDNVKSAIEAKKRVFFPDRP